MKTIIGLPLIIMGSTLLHAGGINVIHLGPQDVIKFQVSAEGASQEFDLAHAEVTGPFILPEKNATIKAIGKELPDLEIPATDKNQLAILAPGPEGYKWQLQPSQPTEEKWGFRVINLSSETAKLLQKGGGISEILAGTDTIIEVNKSAQISVKIQDSIKKSYEGDEPCAVVALLYRENNEWQILFVQDH
ncbi:MAG: hypothetical protein H7Y36_09205 [Armatimonadetes bacterium]|nr:hypothetical protein [Akkermansiaceae bacterium]